jgi:hypothetical protein
VSEINWSEIEKEAAHEALKQAYEREINSLIEEVRQKVNEIAEIDEVWLLHDFLSARRHEIDGKYDDNYSVLVFVFAQLLKEGWLNLDELQALDRDKLAKITALTRM